MKLIMQSFLIKVQDNVRPHSHINIKRLYLLPVLHLSTQRVHGRR